MRHRGVLRSDCGEDIGGRSAGQQAIGDVEIGDDIEVDIDVTDDGFDRIEIDVHVGFHGADDGQIDSGIDGEVAILTIGRSVVRVLRGDGGEDIGGGAAPVSRPSAMSRSATTSRSTSMSPTMAFGIEVDVHVGFQGADDRGSRRRHRR
ncbi:MAG: hypothetical protein AcusKO_24560 [Acuticoccus sp.]